MKEGILHAILNELYEGHVWFTMIPFKLLSDQWLHRYFGFVTWKFNVQCTWVYSVREFTVYVSVQCTWVYSVRECTVYVSVQCTWVYSVREGTVYVSERCTWVYRYVSVQCTVNLKFPITQNYYIIEDDILALTKV